MALAYALDPARRLVSITGEYGDAEEWRTLLASVLADPMYRPGFGFLRDLRGATTPVDAATVVGVIDVVRSFWPMLQPAGAAILTPRSLDDAAMVAQALGDAQHLPLQVFSEYETAIGWLTARQR